VSIIKDKRAWEELIALFGTNQEIPKDIEKVVSGLI
jgi:hypothetical protein